MADHNELGKEGEREAVALLKNKNYRILATNYRYLKAEVDIVAEFDGFLVIVEVKARTNAFLAEMATVITPTKKRLLVLAADHYVAEQELDLEVRFDIISVIKKGYVLHLEHIENAFYHF